MRKFTSLFLLIFALYLGSFAQTIETIKQNATNLVNALQLSGSEKDNFYNTYVYQAQQVKNINNLKLPVKLKDQKVNQTVNAANNQLKSKLSAENKTKFDLYTAQGANLYLNPTITAPTSTVDMNGGANTNVVIPSVTNTNNTTYNSLPAEHQMALNNIKSQLQLNENQFNSFTVDYKSFLESLVKIEQGGGNNAQKQQALINQVITTSNAVKKYLSTEQYAAYENLVKTNQLGKNAIPQLGNNATVTTNNNGLQVVDMSGGSNTNTIVTSPNIPTSNNATYNSLPAEHQMALNNIKSQLQLNENQFNSFTVDYKSFLESLVKIEQGGGNNTQKQQALLKQVITTSNAVKKYLSTEQYAAYENLVKTNQLGKNATPQVSITATTTNPNLPTTVTPTLDAGLNSAGVVDIAKDQIGLSATQATQAKAILAQYDAETANLKSLYPNNGTKQKQECDKLGTKYVPQLQAIMNQNQLIQLAAVVDLQKKFYYGTGLNAQQLKLVNDLKNKYGLSDTQLSQVSLILVEGAIKGNAIKTSGGNAQDAAKLLQELDVKLQAVLTPSQYNAIKGEIMNQIK